RVDSQRPAAPSVRVDEMERPLPRTFLCQCPARQSLEKLDAVARCDRTFVENDFVFLLSAVDVDYNRSRSAGRKRAGVFQNQRLWPNLSDSKPLIADI